MVALEELKSYQNELEGNLNTLRLTHGKLRDQFELLKTHPETVKLAARELGFFRNDEMVLKFQTNQTRALTPLSPGKILQREENQPFQDGFFRLSWVALLLFFYSLLEILMRLLPALGRILGQEPQTRVR